MKTKLSYWPRILQNSLTMFLKPAAASIDPELLSMNLYVEKLQHWILLKHHSSSNTRGNSDLWCITPEWDRSYCAVADMTHENKQAAHCVQTLWGHASKKLPWGKKGWKTLESGGDCPLREDVLPLIPWCHPVLCHDAELLKLLPRNGMNLQWTSLTAVN